MADVTTTAGTTAATTAGELSSVKGCCIDIIYVYEGLLMLDCERTSELACYRTTSSSS